jgi:hypothetical protein
VSAPSPGSGLRILVSGMVAGEPWQGGASWAVMQYLFGLARLGHEVALVEPIGDGRGAGPLSDSASGAYFRRLPLSELEGAALVRAQSRETVGTPYPKLVEFARGADLLLNVSGMLRDERLVEGIPVRVYLDLDPGFNQVWHETGEDVGLDGHTHFVTVGRAIGSADCPVPTCERRWIPTNPPVVLARWPRADLRPAGDAFTTVGHWRSYGPIEYGGIRYGQRVHSFRDLLELPKRVAARFQVALGIHPDEERDLGALRANGWELEDPLQAAGTPDRYAEFVRTSKAEIGIAKEGYVASRCGWFSDRSACYLASGRPVVAQETGFSRHLPTGEGLLAFRSLEEAAACVEEVDRDHARHADAARAIAEEHLESDLVLTSLIERLGSSG